MTPRFDKQRLPAPRLDSDERGSVLLEALISGILLVITAVGVFNAFDAGTRSTAEERYRAQAEGLAQADLARLRTMRISALSNLHETKVVTIEKTPYTVESVAAYQTDKTGTASCAKASASADYIQIRSTITWPSIGSRAPVVEQSLVAPPNGSISAHSGSLAVQIENAANGGVEGVELNGSGAGTFAGVTGANGCAIFGDLPAGNYTLSLSGANLVDKNGDSPKPQSTSVVEESTNTLALQYDFGGRVAAKFQTRVGGELVPSKADSVVAFNSGMQMAKVFGTAGTAVEEVTASPLFPFTSAYSVYAGACTENNPILAGESVPEAAIAEPVVSAGATTPVTIELPALHLTAWSGAEAEPGTRVEGAAVKVTDTKCTAEKPTVRTYTTNAQGELPDPGLPFSTYNVCVANAGKHVSVAGLKVPANVAEMAAGTTLSVFLGASGAETGACP
jgi:Tfp pilus assembly protein PilV